MSMHLHSCPAVVWCPPRFACSFTIKCSSTRLFSFPSCSGMCFTANVILHWVFGGRVGGLQGVLSCNVTFCLLPPPLCPCFSRVNKQPYCVPLSFEKYMQPFSCACIPQTPISNSNKSVVVKMQSKLKCGGRVYNCMKYNYVIVWNSEGILSASLKPLPSLSH